MGAHVHPDSRVGQILKPAGELDPGAESCGAGRREFPSVGGAGRLSVRGADGGKWRVGAGELQCECFRVQSRNDRFIALPPDAPTEVPARTDAIRLQTKPAPDMSRDENFDELERDADELEFRGNHAGDRGANGGQHAAVFAVGV